MSDLAAHQMLEFRFRPANAAQEAFLQATEKIVAYVGGLGSGKTYIGAFWAVLQMLRYPQANGLIAANSYKQLETATLPKVFDFLDRMGIAYRYHATQKELKLVGNQFTGTILCRSLAEYHDLRGTEFFWIWLDETRDTRQEAFQVILGRLRQMATWHSPQRPAEPTPPPECQLRITTTPDMVKSRWLYDFLHQPESVCRLAQQGITIREITASTRDNPYLDPAYVSLLESAYDPQLVRQEVEGQWVLIPPGKPVFAQCFSADTHLAPATFNPDKPLIIGLDWGYLRPAAVFCQEDTADRLWVLGELLERDRETGEFCESIWHYINRHFPGVETVEVYCDPAGNQRNSKSRKTDIEIAREYRLMPICRKSEINEGLTIIRRKLNRLVAGIPSLMIDARQCPLLVEGFSGGYHYAELPGAPGLVSSVPFKDGTYDHLFDALRYVAVNKYHVPSLSPQWEGAKSDYDLVDPMTGY